VFRAEFYADDADVYIDAVTLGIDSLIGPRGGTLAVIERLLTLPQAWVAPIWAPVLGNVVALAVAAIVAAFLASDRMAEFLPRRFDRLVLAAAFVLMPGSLEIFGTLSHIQWIVGAWLLALAVATPSPRTELPLVALACFTGPLVIFFLPLYAARWWIKRDIGPALTVATVAAVVQVLVLSGGARAPGGTPPDVELVPVVLLERIFFAKPPHALALLGIVLIATADVAWRWRLLATVPIISVPIAGLFQTTAPTSQFFDDVSAERYFWLSTGLIVAVLIAIRPARTGPRWSRGVAVAAFAIIFATGLRIPALPVAAWDELSVCIGGPTPCVIPVTPSPLWDLHWPDDWR
jgi:hypothetical protein